jgi:hypothetical protein
MQWFVQHALAKAIAQSLMLSKDVIRSFVEYANDLNLSSHADAALYQLLCAETR